LLIDEVSFEQILAALEIRLKVLVAGKRLSHIDFLFLIFELRYDLSRFDRIAHFRYYGDD